MPDDELYDLVIEWDRRRRAGREVVPETLCRARPELLEPLKDRIAGLRATDWLFDGLDEAAPPASDALPAARIGADQFVSAVTETGLVAAGVLAEFTADLADPRSLATALVRSGRLTRYQAAAILSGSSSPLVLDRYVILDEIGAGGMGRVYKARHRTMDRLVALKVLPAESMDSPEKVRRFEREARAAARLTHPHIVTAFDAHEADGMHFLVMELVNGADLARVVRQRGPLPVAEAIDYVRQAARGLAYAHGCRVVHRDVKPSNLILAGGVVKVLDLGLARFRATSTDTDDQTERELTRDGEAIGTISYMSPEQALDTQYADERSDVYSLGCTLFYLLSGRAPYLETSAMRTLLAHREQPLPSLAEFREDVPSKLQSVLDRMMAKRPQDRIQSMQKVVAALEAIDAPPARAPFGPSMNGCASDDRDTNDFEAAPTRKTACSAAARAAKPPFRWLSRRAVWLTVGFTAALLAALVFRFVTREGTVVVTLDGDQPIRTVAVDGREVTWSYGDEPAEVRFAVDPGPVARITLFLENGTEIEAEIPPEGLTIAAGKPYRLTAEFRPEANRTPAERQRAVIDWVRARGGAIGGGNAEIGYVVVKPDESLPSGRFDLVTIDLAEKPLTDEDLKRIGGLPHLTTLIINKTPIGDRGLANLGDLPELLGVFASETGVTDAGLQSLTRYPKLETLHVAQTEVTGDGLRAAAGWTELKQLFLAGCRIGDESLPALEKLTSLEHLILLGTQLTRAGIERLHEALPACRIESDFGEFGPGPPAHSNDDPDRAVAEWVHALGGTVGVTTPDAGYLTLGPEAELPSGKFNLITLELADKKIAATEFARLDGLEQATTLILNGGSVGDEGIANLGRMPELVNIYIGETHVGDAGLQHLTEQYPKVRALHAGSSRITADAISLLHGWPNLTVLHLQDLPLTDSSIDSLSRLKGLQTLRLGSTGVSRSGVDRLRAALPNCTVESNDGLFKPAPLQGAASLRFDGIDDYVDVPTLSYNVDHPLTIELQVRRDPPLAKHGELISNWRTLDGPAGVGLGWNSHGGWTFGMLCGKESQAASRPEPEPAPKHVAGVWDGRQLAVFFDGKRVSFRDYTPGPPRPQPPGHFVFGAAQTVDGKYHYFFFKGMLDEVRISNVARYSDDYVPISRLAPDEHTLALYHFDAGEGDVLYDASQNGHDGKIHGATWIRAQ